MVQHKQLLKQLHEQDNKAVINKYQTSTTAICCSPSFSRGSRQLSINIGLFEASHF